MNRWIMRVIVENSFELVVGVLVYLAARWLLDLSTPEKDYVLVYRWWPLAFELRWYRGPEYWHQLRGLRILAAALG